MPLTAFGLATAICLQKSPIAPGVNPPPVVPPPVNPPPPVQPPPVQPLPNKTCQAATYEDGWWTAGYGLNAAGECVLW